MDRQGWMGMNGWEWKDGWIDLNEWAMMDGHGWIARLDGHGEVKPNAK